MTAWNPIATAPRETGRPLLLYPFPFPRGSAEKIEALQQSHENGPLLDLGDPALRRMIKLAKRRGSLPYDVLKGFMPSDRFSPEQISDVFDQLAKMGINVVDAEERQERVEPRATAERKELPEAQPEAPASDANLFDASWAVYGNVFEGYWDGTRWLSAGGVPCEPTHWTPALTAAGAGPALKEQAPLPHGFGSFIKHDQGDPSMHLIGTLEFDIRPGTPDNPAGVTIALLRYTRGEDGRLFITPECTSFKEIEGPINSLQDELNEIRERAQRAVQIT